MSTKRLTRRGLLLGAGATLSGCKVFDDLSEGDKALWNVMEGANGLTQRVQRAFIGRGALAKEFTKADIRQGMKPNGVIAPPDQDYQAMKALGFAAWRLEVTGMVNAPLSLSLSDIQGMPQRTQITRHDCVEGWSCIAEWTGVPLAKVLDAAGVRPQAKYVVIHCMDTIQQTLSGGIKYYESIDLVDARHPQTILAWGMNGDLLPERNGAPLRLRVERQLGYKMAKYVRGIELTDRLDGFGRGKGSYWADNGYDWYAGI